MHGHLETEHMRFSHERFHLFEAVLLSADGICFGKHTAGAAELDDLRTVLPQLAHHGTHLFRTIRDGERRCDDRGRKLRGITVAPGRTYGIRCGHDARARDVSLLDALLQSDVVESGRTHVANGGKAR